jgi:DHA1 family tetracycline resistance protein-like MFS transporter
MGFVIGPVLGGFLGEFGSRVPFFFITVLLCFNFVLGFLILPESLTAENRRSFEITRANPFSTFKQLRKFKVVFGIMGVMFIYNLGHHVLPAIWSFYTIEKFSWSPREIGYSLGFIGILMVFVQGFLIRIVIPRIGVRLAGIMGLSLTVVAFTGYAGATSSWMMYAVMIPGALSALAGPSLSSIASTQVGKAQQGELQGGLSSMMSLTSILSPPIMTQTFGLFSGVDHIYYFPGAPFLLAAVLTVFSLALFIRVTSNLEMPRSED